MIKINKENSRGKGDYGWLRANYSFSFSSYYNPEKMGFNRLRVINEDFVAPGQGFPTHSHKNMEIITFVLKGKLAHKDSLGNTEYLEPGKIQRMYAGSGVTHSEFNGSETEELNLLQIWIEPNKIGSEAEYNESEFDLNKKGEQLLASETGLNQSIKIYQKMDLSLLQMDAGDTFELKMNGKDTYVHVISGELNFDNKFVSYGDSIEISKVEKITLSADKKSRLLVFRFK